MDIGTQEETYEVVTAPAEAPVERPREADLPEVETLDPAEVPAGA